MSPLALGLVLAGAAFAAMHGLALGLRTLVWRRESRRSDARRLFWLAVLPTLVPVGIAFGVLLPSFLLHEPIRGDEQPGLVLWSLAIVGGLQIASVLGGVVQMLRRSRALQRRWSRGAQPLPTEIWGLRALSVDLGHPEVALAGIWKPCLFVDRRILDTCSVAELEAIAAHEQAHVRSRDNLRRLLVEACNRASSPVAIAWRRAAEVHADTCAARSSGCAVELASALVRVSRLIVARPTPSLPVSAVHDGGNVHWRVRNLLSPHLLSPASQPRGGGWILGVGGIVLAASLTRRAHAALEYVLHLLP